MTISNFIIFLIAFFILWFIISKLGRWLSLSFFSKITENSTLYKWKWRRKMQTPTNEQYFR